MESEEGDTNRDQDFIDKTSFPEKLISPYRKLIDHIEIGAKLGIKCFGKKISVFEICEPC